MLDWLRSASAQADGPTEPQRLTIEQGAQRLSLAGHQQTGDSDGGADWLIIMREVSDVAVIEAMSLSFKPTFKEAEVLYWW